MGCSVDLENLPGVDVSVALGGREARMAQKLLNGTKIRPAAEEVGREAMAQGVWTDLGLQGQGPDPRGDEVSDASICQSTTAMVDERARPIGGATLRRVSR